MRKEQASFGWGGTFLSSCGEGGIYVSQKRSSWRITYGYGLWMSGTRREQFKQSVSPLKCCQKGQEVEQPRRDLLQTACKESNGVGLCLKSPWSLVKTNKKDKTKNHQCRTPPGTDEVWLWAVRAESQYSWKAPQVMSCCSWGLWSFYQRVRRQNLDYVRLMEKPWNAFSESVSNIIP